MNVSNFFTDLIKEHIKELNSRGVGDRSKSEILLLVIFLNYLFEINRKSGNTNIDIEVFAKELNEKQSVIRLVKAFKEAIPDMPLETQDVDSINFASLKQGQFFELFKEWRVALKYYSAIWQSSNLLSLIELLESFIESDYKSRFSFSTPFDLVSLLSNISTINDNVETLYDPYARTGEIISKVFVEQDKASLQFYASVDNGSDLMLAKMRLYMLQIQHIEWIEQAGQMPQVDIKFDYIISNPPFGLLHPTINKTNAGYWLSNFGSNKSEVDFLCHILDHLSDTGQAIVIVPAGILSSRGKVELLRSKIIEDGILEAIISLPAKIFYNTGVASAILIFNKSKRNNNIILLDGTDLGRKDKNKQVLLNEDINLVTEILQELRKESNKPFSPAIKHKLVSRLDMAENRYDFQISAYHADIVHKPGLKFEDIYNECLEIEGELAIVQKNIKALLKQS